MLLSREMWRYVCGWMMVEMEGDSRWMEGRKVCGEGYNVVKIVMWSKGVEGGEGTGMMRGRDREMGRGRVRVKGGQKGMKGHVSLCTADAQLLTHTERISLDTVDTHTTTGTPHNFHTTQLKRHKTNTQHN